MATFHPEPTNRAGTKRQISSTRVRTDKFFSRRQNSRRSEPSRLPSVSLRCDLLVRSTILLDLRSDMRPLIRIFRGMNSEQPEPSRFRTIAAGVIGRAAARSECGFLSSSRLRDRYAVLSSRKIFSPGGTRRRLLPVLRRYAN
jgi:hypothetical protein